MKKLILGAIVFASTLLASDGAAIYKKCTACHGIDGKMKYSGKVPALAGQDKNALIEQMKGYQSGTINKYAMGAVMSAQAKLHLKSDADIEAVADYLSALK